MDTITQSIPELTKPPYDLNRLTGKLCKLMPYARGYYKRDTLSILWNLMENDGGSDVTFHGMPELGFEFPNRGDLVDFVNYFSVAGRLLLIVVDLESDEIAGFIWFDDIIPKHKASVSIFIAKKYRGDFADEASIISLDYIFNFIQVNQVWGFTPWLSAVQHGLHLGFLIISTLPDFELYKDKLQDMYIMKITKEIYNGRFSR